MVSIDRNLDGVYECATMGGPRRTKSLAAAAEGMDSAVVVAVVDFLSAVGEVADSTVPGESFSSISPPVLVVGGTAAAFHGTLACVFPGHVAACL